jgi:nitroreductase
MHGSGETDAAIVTTHMMLAAWEMGIGSCWIGSFDPEAVKVALGIDTGLRVAAILSLGYPSEDSSPLPLHSDNPDKKDKVTYI